MFDQIWNFIARQVAENELFSGGLILMLGGAALASCRRLPWQLWERLKSCWVIELDILDRDPAFDWLDRWLAQHPYARNRARWLTVQSRSLDYEARQEDAVVDRRPQIFFSPAPGQHYLFYRGRLLILNRVRNESDRDEQQSVNVRETFQISLFSRNRRLARQLLEDARDVALPPGENRLAVHRATYASWSEQLNRLPRPAESVVLKAGVMEDLLDDARLFLSRRQWYVARGIPYRRGYLLHGPPGTGKSSAVLAVASTLKMDIAVLNLNGAGVDDGELCDLLAEAPTNAIVLIEDIDCAFVERAAGTEKGNKLTFSGLLNAIDGVAASEGRILFATTNHLSRLDPALVRPGRIDRKFEIGHADRDQARRLFQRFFPSCAAMVADDFAAGIVAGKHPMSSLQSHLLRYADDPQLAVERMHELHGEEPNASWQITPHREISEKVELFWGAGL